MSSLRSACIALILCVGAATTREASPVQLAIRADVVAMNDAIIHGDFGKVVDLTYPKVVEMLGGREEMIAKMRAGMRQMKDGGFTALPAEVGIPSDPIVARDQAYVVAPFRAAMRVPAGRMSQATFVIGVSGDGGKTWTFINGDLGRAAIKRVLPNLPDQLQLPTRAAPVVEKE